jgi:uncharacterized SAM-binding protein YcdF (DUF218 family)
MPSRILVLSFRALGLFAPLAAAVFAFEIASFDPTLRPGPPLDAAIVLGAAAHGGRPSPVFAARLDYGERLLREGRVRYVIVTGGGRDDPTQPEARAGRDYLLARGNEPERVLFETRSWTTPENLCFALKVGAAHGLRSYAIVSDPLHLRRAMHYARDLRIDARAAGTPYTRYRGSVVRLGFVARETYVYARHMLAGPVRCAK